MPSTDTTTRRRLLGALAAVGVGGLAGCSGSSDGADCTSAVNTNDDTGTDALRGVSVAAVEGDAILAVRVDAAAVADGAADLLAVYDYDRRETTIPLAGAGALTDDGDARVYRTNLGSLPRHGRYQVVARRTTDEWFTAPAVDRLTFDFHCTRD
jgi:hypothetical protein